MLAPSMLTSGPTSSPPRWAASSVVEQRMGDGEVEVDGGIGLGLQRVVPPLVRVRVKAASLHDRAKVLAVCRFDLRDALRPMMGDRIHQVVITAHRSEFASRQVKERQVHA